MGDNLLMQPVANIRIHASQFPGNVWRDLFASLRTRRVNHKFHYDSVKQTQKWLALHQLYSPTRNDPDCRAVYEKGFAAAAAKMTSRKVHVIGLGCGGGQKDTRLLDILRTAGKEICYTPCDVSASMVLVARLAALAVVPAKKCFPFVFDLASAEGLPGTLAGQNEAKAARLITFFGMIPNFEPQTILPRLATLVRPQDSLLLSANLAPGKDDADGLKKILPQYDNLPTRDWLLAFLFGLGVEKSDGRLKFGIKTGGFGLKRIVANFHFNRARRIQVEARTWNFVPGQNIRLFFSYRYTPGQIQKILAAHGLVVCDRWVAKSQEEGVFLCRRK